MLGEEQIKKDPSISSGQDKIPALRTLKTDTSEYVKKKGVSLIEIAAQEARGAGLKIEEENKFSLKKIIIISTIILALAGAAIGGILFLLKKEKETAEKIFSPKSLLVSEEQMEIVVYPENHQRFLRDIQTAVKSETQINQLVYLSPVKWINESKFPVGTREFFMVIGISPPFDLLDSLEERFMLAKFYLTEDQPLLLFKVRSYDSAFNGMMKWEKAMADDLRDIFSLDISKAKDFFEDKEILNRDTRILNDKEDRPLLIYSFVNRNYLVITVAEEPLKEIFRRLSSSQYLNN